MDLLDKAKELKLPKINTKGLPDFESIKEMFGSAKDEKIVLKISMLGARGVGKTSVLTAMYSNMDEAVKNTNMFINAENSTHLKLKQKEEELKCMFTSNRDLSDSVGSGIAATAEETVFEFNMGLTTEKINLGLEIRDYPGEYLRTKPDVVKAYIEQSNAIILAIDTPHLMEEKGKYNEQKNRTQLITEFFKESIRLESDEKLIMFVPLKCEKYFHENRIDEVTEKICQEYKELIAFLQDKGGSRGIQGKFACMIAPIQTIGEIVFDGFERDKSDCVKCVDISGELFPEKVNYRYSWEGAEYKPNYCEQPVMYLLSFVARQYYQIKNTPSGKFTGFIKKLKDTFAPTPKSDELMKEIGKLTTMKNYDKNGYKILFGRGKVR